MFNFGFDRLFDNFEVRRPPLPRLSSWVERRELLDLVRDLSDGLFLAMRKHVSAGTDPRFVVEKTPVDLKTGELDLARKREVYPDAWYLHIIRDREAVTNSLMRAPWISDRSYEACSSMWDKTVGFVRETFGDLERYRELSYEELREDPGEALRPVFESARGVLGRGHPRDDPRAVQAAVLGPRGRPGRRTEGPAAQPARARLDRS